MKKFTVSEAAERLHISESSVYEMCKKNEIEYSRYGPGKGRIIITEEAILAYEAKRLCRPGDDTPPLNHITL